MRFVDITGQKFGYLTAIKRAEDKVYPSGKKYQHFYVNVIVEILV